MVPKAMLIDISKCIGCRSCQIACKQWNGLPAVATQQRGTFENPPQLSASTWTRVEFREGPEEWIFRKHQCMHCAEASCISVCPSDAITHQDGLVVIDQKWCIGCGYCEEACPFGAVYREPPKGTAWKCTFCIDRVTNGLTPACAKTCPTGAIQFGERADLIAAAHQRVTILIGRGYPQARTYGETELGGLGQMYILTKPSAYLGLPEKPLAATSGMPEKWLSGIAMAGLLVLPIWWLFQRGKQVKAEQESKVIGNMK